jgi:hypothetical protein
LCSAAQNNSAWIVGQKKSTVQSCNTKCRVLEQSAVMHPLPSLLNCNRLACSSIQCDTVYDSARQYSSGRNNTERRVTVQNSEVQCSAVQYATVSRINIQCSVVQFNAAQYRSLECTALPRIGQGPVGSFKVPALICVLYGHVFEALNFAVHCIILILRSHGIYVQKPSKSFLH